MPVEFIPRDDRPVDPTNPIGPGWVERRKVIPLTPEAHAKICSIDSVDERIDSLYGRLEDGQNVMQWLKQGFESLEKAGTINTERMTRIERLQYDLATKIEALGRTDDARTEAIDKRLDNQDKMMQENTSATMELLDVMRSGKGFFRVVGWVARAVKWTAGIVFAVGSVWFLFKDHNK